MTAEMMKYMGNCGKKIFTELLIGTKIGKWE